MHAGVKAGCNSRIDIVSVTWTEYAGVDVKALWLVEAQTIEVVGESQEHQRGALRT